MEARCTLQKHRQSTVPTCPGGGTNLKQVLMGVQRRNLLTRQKRRPRSSRYPPQSQRKNTDRSVTLSNALAYVLLQCTLSKLPTLAPFLTLGQPAAPHAEAPSLQ